MTDLFLTRARLSASFDRLAPLLLPENGGARLNATHRLVWTMFPRELKQRPFLYRETKIGSGGIAAACREMFVLSSLQPDDETGLFQLETKPFAPALKPGDRLQFSLRANPVVSRNVVDANGAKKVVRRDVVMEALHHVEKGNARAKARPEIVRAVGLDWLSRQGETAGFFLPDRERIAVDGYEQIAIDPLAKGRAGVHSRLDFDGVLEVQDPSLFLRKLAEGFGRARAFGHGLMLIKRA